ncbi:MAG: CDP-diacylglycerol--glycerol-3-phosphate 3-phosphatidyltransferase [Mycobacteriaceae bacterium]
MNPDSPPSDGMQARPVPLLNIANALTAVRIILVPVFLLALFWQGGTVSGWRVCAFIIFSLAVITDRFDGQLARKYGLVTDFGKLADPIADKALIGAALIGLSLLGDISWWVTAVIGVRELGITALRLWVIKGGVIPASRGGKVKTFFQSIAIGLYVLPLPEVIAPVVAALMLIAIVLTVITGIDYVLQAIRLRSTAPQKS